MSTSVFILVIAAIGFVFTLLFRRMKERHDRHHPEERHGSQRNPIDSWLTGEVEKDEADEEDTGGKGGAGPGA